ncbi:hypothetical protein BH11PLA1_BH11PLA1_01600 [soil metagenome]
MRQALAALAPIPRATAAASLRDRLAARLASARAGTVMLFAPLADEPDLAPLVQGWVSAASGFEPGHTGPSAADSPAALRSPPRVCIPRLNWETRLMHPVLIRDWSRDLVLERLNLRVPRPDLPEIPIEELDAVVVPGLAFTRDGRRLGRGAGFYDRFLALLPARVLTIGICFEVQFIADVPVDEHDRRVREVLSA